MEREEGQIHIGTEMRLRELWASMAVKEGENCERDELRYSLRENGSERDKLGGIHSKRTLLRYNGVVLF